MEIALARGRITGPAALLVVSLLFLAGAAYFAGLIPFLGYEKHHKTYNGFASGTKSGTSIGPKTMIFFEGQTFFARYEATVREGSLRIGILETFGPIGRKPHHVEATSESGSGEVTYRIPKTSVYSIYFEGSVLAPNHTGRYDIDYSVTWGAR